MKSMNLGFSKTKELFCIVEKFADGEQIVLDTLEQVDFDGYLYRCLKEEGYRRILFISYDISSGEFVFKTFDAISFWTYKYARELINVIEPGVAVSTDEELYSRLKNGIDNLVQEFQLTPQQYPAKLFCEHTLMTAESAPNAVDEVAQWQPLLEDTQLRTAFVLDMDWMLFASNNDGLSAAIRSLHAASHKRMNHAFDNKVIFLFSNNENAFLQSLGLLQSNKIAAMMNLPVIHSKGEFLEQAKKNANVLFPNCHCPVTEEMVVNLLMRMEVFGELPEGITLNYARLHRYAAAILKQEENPQAKLMEIQRKLRDGGYDFSEALKDVSMEDAVRKLDKVLGMDGIKDQISRRIKNFDIERMRGRDKLEQHLNMRFVGPPGTGKTTVARIVAEMFCAKGMLEKSEPVYIKALELVSPYVSGTHGKAAKIIRDAMGGVLIIDEVHHLYSKANGLDGEGSHGKEAIQALVAELQENTRGKICVILAGYKEEVEQTLALDPGMPSRFPTEIVFKNYDVDTLCDIFRFECKENQITIDDEVMAAVRGIIARAAADAGKDFGNARFVKEYVYANIKEALNVRVSDGGVSIDDEEFNRIRLEDVQAALPVEYRKYREMALTSTAYEDTVRKFDRMLGMDGIKSQIYRRIKHFDVERLRGNGILKQHLNMRFVGPPGTGKSTVAKIAAEMFCAKGMLEKSEPVYVKASELIGQYVGHTPAKARTVIRSAMGGVLVLDEIHQLNGRAGGEPGAGGFGIEVIQALVSELQEETRGRICVILAGYKKEVDETLRLDPGMPSRFPTEIVFENYDADTLCDIFSLACSENQITIDDDAMAAVRGIIARTAADAGEDFGNARYVNDSVYAKIKEALNVRVSDGGVSIDDEEFNRIRLEDVQAALSVEYRKYREMALTSTAYEDAVHKFDKLLGMERIKGKIRSIINRFDTERLRGNGILEKHLNMRFVGPPGTGKTTVAKIVAEMFCSKGILQKSEPLIMQATELIAQYVGQTPERTRRIIRGAMGGVLVLDEIHQLYSLAGGEPGSGSFGIEVLQTLVAELQEDTKGKICVILTGYKEDVDRTLALDRGAKRRFPTEIVFENYDVDTLCDIFRLVCSENQVFIDDDAMGAVQSIIARAAAGAGEDFGNAGFVQENVYEVIMTAHDERVSGKDVSVDDEEFNRIRLVDVQTAFESDSI